MKNKIWICFLMIAALITAAPLSIYASNETINPRLAPCMHCGKAGVMPASQSRTRTIGYERVQCVHGMTGLDDKITYVDESGALCTYCGQINWYVKNTYSEYIHLVP